MVQSINVLLAIDKAHTVPQRVMDCRPVLVLDMMMVIDLLLLL